MDGWRWREERELEKLALLATWIVNNNGTARRGVNPVMLLGKEKTHRINDGEPRMTPEEIEASKRELIAKLEPVELGG